MKVSVITIVYNSRNTIQDAINSVYDQSYNDIEHIIVDGKSEDGTLEVIKKNRCKITKYISEKDEGIYDAMNKGVSMATGDVVGILNSDDVYHDNNVINMVVDEFSKKDVDGVYGDLVYVEKNNLNSVLREWISSDFESGSFRRGWHPAHPTFFLRRDIYTKYGNFDTKFHVSADFEFMLRLFEVYGISTSYIPQLLVKMRAGGESNMSLNNILIGNKNIRNAFRKHNINISRLYTVKRLAKKIRQRIGRQGVEI